jgi:hypothetical protein
VLANEEKFRVRSKTLHGGAGLRRCNRSRGFFANFARHRNLRDNYKILQGLNCKKLETGSNGDDGYCSSNSHRSRARKVARSGANERGPRGDSIPYLTYSGGASWRSNFAEEVATAGLFCSWLHFCPWRQPSGLQGGAAQGKQAGDAREEAGRAGVAHSDAWRRWDSGWAGAHGAALPGGCVQHQEGTQAGEGARPQQGNGRQRIGRR